MNSPITLSFEVLGLIITLVGMLSSLKYMSLANARNNEKLNSEMQKSFSQINTKIDNQSKEITNEFKDVNSKIEKVREMFWENKIKYEEERLKLHVAMAKIENKKD
jgi:DNA-binding protein H-NS